MSFDFQSGVKTTVFVDDTKVEEPFDPAAMKGLAAAPTHAPGTRNSGDKLVPVAPFGQTVPEHDDVRHAVQLPEQGGAGLVVG